MFEYLGRHAHVVQACKTKEPYSLVQVMEFLNDASDGGNETTYQELYSQYVASTFETHLVRSAEDQAYEASPRYYHFPELAPFVRDLLPCVRLVMTLRAPLDRAISHYWHDHRTKARRGKGGTYGRTRLVSHKLKRELALSEFLEAERDQLELCLGKHGQVPVTWCPTCPESMLWFTDLRSCLNEPPPSLGPMLSDSRKFKFKHFGYFIPSLYAIHLEPWLRNFPRSKIHFMKFEDWTSPGALGSSILNLTQFLGLPDWDPVSLSEVESLGAFMAAPNGTTYHGPDPIEHKALLADLGALLPLFNALLSEMVGIDFSDWNDVSQWREDLIPNGYPGVFPADFAEAAGEDAACAA